MNKFYDIWECKIGFEKKKSAFLSDQVMREGVQNAALNLFGYRGDFIFSGWGAKLNEGQRAFVEMRAPDIRKIRVELDWPPEGYHYELVKDLK